MEETQSDCAQGEGAPLAVSTAGGEQGKDQREAPPHPYPCSLPGEEPVQSPQGNPQPDGLVQQGKWGVHTSRPRRPYGSKATPPPILLL